MPDIADSPKPWNIMTSFVPYDPAGEFAQALERVKSQEDVDTFEKMARDHQKAVQEAADLREQLAIWRNVKSRSAESTATRRHHAGL